MNQSNSLPRFGAVTRMVPALAAGMLYFGAFSLPARADCEDPKNAFDDVYCYSKLYIEADADLNKAYGDLAKLLSKDEKSILKKGELSWMRARNAKCSRQEGEDNFVDLNCAVDETRSRIGFLEERAQECKASKCQAGKLGD